MSQANSVSSLTLKTLPPACLPAFFLSLLLLRHFIFDRPTHARTGRPQFYEIYKHGAVLGISLTFMAVDLLGGVSSILSLIFKKKVDALAAVAYSLVVVRPPSRLPVFFR